VSQRWHGDYAEYVEARLPWLRRIAFLLCQDWHSADDLVQVTATRLFTKWPRAARMDNVDAYVRTILVRAFLGERRSAWFRRVRLPGSLADRAAGVQGGTMSRSAPEQLLLFAEPGPNAAPVMLTMYPAGKCRLAGTALPCSPYNTEWQVLSRAPDVNGRPAYWLKGGQGLAWQYAPAGWAELDWGGAGQSVRASTMDSSNTK